MKTLKPQGLSPAQNAGDHIMEQNLDFLQMMQRIINNLKSGGDQKAYGEIGALLFMAQDHQGTEAGEMYRQMACYIRDNFPFKDKSILSEFEFS